jgi:DNA repair protein RecO (recombination protein O)
LDILTEAKLISRFRPQGKELDRYYGGYYVAELLAGLHTLSRLQEANPKLAILRFELATLREIGQLPMFDRCVGCGRTAQGDGHWSFSMSQGGLVCQDCSKEFLSGTPISAGTVAVLRRLSDESDAVVERLHVAAGQLR